MHFKMHADSLGPIYYQNVPLDALQFKLIGNAEQLSIHDLRAAIAKDVLQVKLIRLAIWSSSIHAD